MEYKEELMLVGFFEVLGLDLYYGILLLIESFWYHLVVTLVIHYDHDVTMLVAGIDPLFWPILKSG